MSMTPNATLQFLQGRVPPSARGAAPPAAPEFAAIFAAAAGETGETGEERSPARPPSLRLSAAFAEPDAGDIVQGKTAAGKDAFPTGSGQTAGQTVAAVNARADAHAGTAGKSLATPPLVPAVDTDEAGADAAKAILRTDATDRGPRRETSAEFANLKTEANPPFTPSRERVQSQAPSAPGTRSGEPGEAILQRLAGYIATAPARSGEQPAPGAGEPLLPVGVGGANAQPIAGTVARAKNEARSPRAPASTPQPGTNATAEGEEADTRTVRGGLPHAQATPLRRGAARAAGDTEKPAAPVSIDALTVTRKETHFAPVRRPASIDAHLWSRTGAAEAAPSREVAKPSFAALAEQIRPAFEQARADLETRAPQLLQAQQAGAGHRFIAPVRVMEISLQPASLGALAVTMRITGTGLRVTIAASQRETAAALEEDIEKLETLVRAAGFDPDAIDVRFEGASVKPRVS